MALKNTTPCFHRTISIQIDSPLPQNDTQAISGQSDVESHNKRQFPDDLILYYIIKNNHIITDLSLILNGSKDKSPLCPLCFYGTWAPISGRTHSRVPGPS